MLKYIRIPADLFIALRGHDKAARVLETLLFNRNVRTNYTRFMAVSEIADIAGVSLRHAYRILDQLVESQYIEMVAVRRGERMYYLSVLESKPDIADDPVNEIKEDNDEAEARWDAHIAQLTGGNKHES